MLQGQQIFDDSKQRMVWGKSEWCLEKRCPCRQRARPQNHVRIRSRQCPGRCIVKLQKTAEISKANSAQPEY